jgi:hypothetical protein
MVVNLFTQPGKTLPALFVYYGEKAGAHTSAQRKRLYEQMAREGEDLIARLDGLTDRSLIIMLYAFTQAGRGFAPFLAAAMLKTEIPSLRTIGNLTDYVAPLTDSQKPPKLAPRP